MGKDMYISCHFLYHFANSSGASRNFDCCSTHPGAVSASPQEAKKE
jgi:hypothetical protein